MYSQSFPRKLGTHGRQSFGFIISETLLEKLQTDFNIWSHNVELGLATPKNDIEAGFWKENLAKGNSLFSKGFFDAKLIPAHHVYPCASNIANAMWELKAKLDAIQMHLGPEQYTLLPFKADFARQVSINLILL
jgi:hypothetical protein